ncbi:Phage protein D [Serratia rubidaea]|uniref:Phage protein D n=1 Tax=Serratia rubidaea TaxID=61652 RepID=A0A4U9HGJ7_SERRU|nr:Phage protein D [Serratia rubidaea]
MENVQREEYRPEFSLTAEGRDITALMRENLVEIRLTDNGGATAKADELQITILSETMALPNKGARLRLGLGFNGVLQDKGWFVVSGISSSGPPRKIVIYATAAPMNAQRQPGDVLNQKSRSWDDVNLGDIVKTVASDNGLIPKVAGALADIAVGHLDQVNESDAALMTRLASRFNAISKPSGGYWLFLQQGESLSVGGKALASVTILKEEVSEWSYTDGQQRGATTGPGKKGEGGKKGKISVAYFDPEDGRTKTQSLEHDGPSQSHPSPSRPKPPPTTARNPEKRR